VEKLTFRDFKNGKGHHNLIMRYDDMKELKANGIKNDDILIHFIYSDYGGDYLDRVAIKYFSQKKYQNCFRVYNIFGGGKSGLLWGTVASRFFQKFRNTAYTRSGM
jgi:hypothetical protein